MEAIVEETKAYESPITQGGLEIKTMVTCTWLGEGIRILQDTIAQRYCFETRLTDDFDSILREIEIIVSSGHKVLLDKYEPGVAGGTGKTFDWNIAKLASEQFEIILAGGLTPTNIAAAIKKVDPWCVDVSSGVESNGLKDLSKIIEFATSVRQSEELPR